MQLTTREAVAKYKRFTVFSLSKAADRGLIKYELRYNMRFYSIKDLEALAAKLYPGARSEAPTPHQD